MLVLLLLLILALLIQYLRIVAEIRAENIDKVRVFFGTIITIKQQV